MSRAEKRTAEQIRATAIHESGHAVIGRVLGYQCGKVTIRARAGTSGYSVTADLWDALDRWERTGKAHRSPQTALRARIMIQMAGRAAEEECLGHCQGGDGDDQFRAAGMIMDLVGDGQWVEAEALEQRLKRATALLVQRHRSKIEALASALLDQPVMTDRQIRAAIGMGPAPRRSRRRRGINLRDPELIALAASLSAPG